MRVRGRAKVLVVEDDPKTADIIAMYLKHEGMAVVVVDDGLSGLARARDDKPDLVILDIMLPRMDGLELCRRLRAESEAPVIMVTARATEDDKIAGLSVGADDYVSKPFSPRELIARVHAVLRRGGSPQSGRRRRFEFDGLVLDAHAHEVTVDGQPVSLTPAEFDLLEAMCRSPGRLLTRADLVGLAFGFDYEGTDRTIDTHIARLRRKLGHTRGGSEYIDTVFGKGYRFAGKPRHA